MVLGIIVAKLFLESNIFRNFVGMERLEIIYHLVIVKTQNQPLKKPNLGRIRCLKRLKSIGKKNVTEKIAAGTTFVPNVLWLMSAE